MGSYHLKHFEFYQQTTITNLNNLVSDNKIQLHGTPKGLIVTDSLGNVILLDTNLAIKQKYQAYEESSYSVKFLHYLNEEEDILLTIGESEGGSGDNNFVPILKVWELFPKTKFLNRTWLNINKNLPNCLKTLKLNNSLAKLSCLSISKDKNNLVVGSMDGQVILIQANLIKDRFIKQKVIHTCTEKITGLGFSDYNNEEQLTLFIITTREILTYSIGNHEYKQVLDDQGCNLNCTSMVDNSFHKGITMARNDAFYFYDTEGRGPCLAFEGIKSSIGWYDTQLVILSPLMDRVQPYRIQDMISEEERQESKKIEIYDVTQKLIAYSYNFEQNIQNLCYTNNCFYILLKDGELIKIYEKEVQNKLEILLKQDLFQLSLNICQSNKGVDNKQLADIHKKFADFLYQKGEFDDAMDQYINTLAYLEPSYVIRKYLDGQRLQSLTRYLQALHNHPSKMANPDHTTLLLNCYTKLKEEDKIEQFINSNTTMELNFELEIGIKVLRQAQYFNQALELAKKYQQHDWCLKILIEDQCEYKQGYEYLLELSQEEQKYYVMEYGRILIKNIHDKLIQLLIQLSTENKNKNINPIEFISIFIDYPIYCILYLEQYVNIQFNLDLNNIKHQSININNNEKNGRRNSMNNKEETIIWDTLLELYLANFNSEILFNEDKKNYYQTLKNKILFILNNKKINYDINFAMVLCKQYSFDEGLILLFEKLEMYQDILNHYIKLQDVNNILETLRKYGFKEVYLYHLTLEYFSTSNHAILNYPIQFRQVLDIIEDNNIIPPLHVIQALSRNSIVTIGTLKPFILKGIKQDLNSIEKDQARNLAYEVENQKKEIELEELKNKVKIFQLTKCSSCSTPLDLPLLHFLCKHSFHIRCLGQTRETCPICENKDQMILKLDKVMEEEAMNHQLFIEKIQETEDHGLDLIYEQYSKNSFSFLS